MLHQIGDPSLTLRRLRKAVGSAGVPRFKDKRSLPHMHYQVLSLDKRLITIDTVPIVVSLFACLGSEKGLLEKSSANYAGIN